MAKYFLFFFSLFACFLCPAQSDTALVSFRKLFKYKPLPYDAMFTDKEFVMDSIRNSVDKKKYFRYRSDIRPRPDNLKIGRHLVKRFIKMDTIGRNELGDSVKAEFYALGLVGSIPNVLCYIVERQFCNKYYRSSAKFLVTYDRKCRMIDRMELTHAIPGVLPADEYGIVKEDALPWFELTEGVIYEDYAIVLVNEVGTTRRYYIYPSGRIGKRSY
jgi:hypothetical protein